MRKLVSQIIAPTFMVVMIIISIFSHIPFANAQNRQIQLIVDTDKALYEPGDKVTIYGLTTFNMTPVSGVSLAIEVRNTRNSTIFLDLVYSQNDGSFKDSFRLSQDAVQGTYTVYITAYKPGHQTASAHKKFEVAYQTYVKIVAYQASLSVNNTVTAILNVTLSSRILQSLRIGYSFLLISPEGAVIYHFSDAETIYNETISTIKLVFPLPPTTPGPHMYTFSIFDEEFKNMLESTGFQVAFIYMPPVIVEYDLGSLNAENSSYEIVDREFNRFESLKCTFNISKPVSWIMIFVDNPSLRCIATLNGSLIYSFNELPEYTLISAIPKILPEPLSPLLNLLLLRSLPTWVLFNVPAGYYELLLAHAQTQHIGYICILTGPEITDPSVKIISIEETAETTSPNGILNYNIYIAWNITSSDTIRLYAEIGGEVVDEKLLDVEPLHGCSSNQFLAVKAPDKTGDYDVRFKAKLEKANILDSASAILHVRAQNYNITFAGTIQYWKTPTFWGHLLGQQYELHDSQQHLSALKIEDLKVVKVNEWNEDGTPKTVTISFNATNKVSGEVLQSFKFGEGVHYDIYIRPFGAERTLLKVLIAGDTEVVIAKLPVKDGKLIFEIIYSQCLVGGILEMSAGIIKSALTIILGGVGGVKASMLTDMAKLTCLYMYKFITEYMNGYFTTESALSFLLELGFTYADAELELADQRTDNPYFALWSVILNTFYEKKLDIFKLVYAAVKLAIHFVTKIAPKIAEIMSVVLEKYVGIKFKLELPGDLGARISGINFEQLLDALRSLLTIGETIVTIWRYFTSPAEEGKWVSDAKVGEGAAAKVDPKISICFSGPLSNSNVSMWVKDIKRLIANITATAAEIFMQVDYPLTTTYLAILSEISNQRTFLRGFGFNASEVEFNRETNNFHLFANGSIYTGLDEMFFNINETFINGYQTMSLDALRSNATHFWLNCSLIYPFGKDLNYEIKVALPTPSSIIEVISDENYIVEDSTVTWNASVEQIAILFTYFANDTTPPHIVLVSQFPSSNEVMPNQDVKVYANITDDISGVKNVILSYNLDDAPVWFNITMWFNETSQLYEATILRQKAGTFVKYMIIAYDNNDNCVIEDNVGQYYVYTVIPEFSHYQTFLFLTTSLMLIAIMHKKKQRSNKIEHKSNLHQSAAKTLTSDIVSPNP